MKKVVLMALALGLSLPAMASEKVIDMYKSELWLLFPVGQSDGKRRV